MLKLEEVVSRQVPRLGPYAQAIRAGDLIFVAGQPGIDPLTREIAGATFEVQARQAFKNLRDLLADAGSGLERIVKVTCFLADASAFGLLNEIYAEHFPECPPVRSTPIVALPHGLLISIDAIALTGE